MRPGLGTCYSSVCPEGGAWGECLESSHWTERKNADDPSRVPMTTAHLLQTAGYNLGHAIVHTAAASKLAKVEANGGPETDMQFNLEHATHHLGEVQDHLKRLVDHVREHYPDVSAQLGKLEKVEVV